MSLDFVEWREEFISQERGNRVVHYYLDDSSGESHLAVVGTEKSIRHMFYVVPEEFCRVHGESLPGVSGLKWRSKREVVGWLTKFAPQRDDSSEGMFLERQRRDLRISRDWMRNQWVDVDVKPNILSAISMVRSGSTSGKGAESGSSAMPDRGIRAVEADGKTPASLSSESDKLPDEVERADSRKWCRDDSEGANEGGDS